MIREEISALARRPYRGTRRPELGDAIRNLTIERAIIYFELLEDAETLRVLAVFFGGQDHLRHIRKRLPGASSDQ